MKRFAGFLGRSPDTASAEDLRSYQLHVVDHGISPISLNATLTGLKFLFATTLDDHPELLTKMHAVHVPHKLPVQAVSKRKNTPNRSSKPYWRLAKTSTVDCREQIVELNQNRYFDMYFFRIDY